MHGYNEDRTEQCIRSVKSKAELAVDVLVVAPQSQLNKWVFSSFLNWPTVVSDWRSEAGRLFQSLGPATCSIVVKLMTDTKHRAAYLRQQSFLFYSELWRIKLLLLLLLLFLKVDSLSTERIHQFQADGAQIEKAPGAKLPSDVALIIIMKELM